MQPHPCFLNDIPFPGLSARLSRIREDYPLVWQELQAFSGKLPDWDRTAMEILYAGLDCHDLPSVTPEQIHSYVRASRQALERIPYASRVPAVLFYQYVLPPRVNNEWLDGSRQWLLDQLLGRILGKDILSAALEVNYWCAEEAAYLPADNRTISPLGMCRRAQGRCGEESTLLVSALRAVGIPARQCYAPFWAHCDDNHAWVEFWATDGWHYMGACEPEWQPDAGWFQAAASKAPLIRSRVPDFTAPSGYQTVNSTGFYGETVPMEVLVTHLGHPVPDVEVRFQLINYSRIQTLHSCVTGETGKACMEAGIGTLIVSVCVGGILVERLVDLRQEQSVVLQLEHGCSPENEAVLHWTLTPGSERIPRPLPENRAHQEKIARCQRLHSQKLSDYNREPDLWLQKARGNRAEIKRFLDLPQFTEEEKRLLLETLTEKDSCDCTCEALESYLSAALPYRNRFPQDQWQLEILAPRVEWEPLLPIRAEIQRLVSGWDLKNPRQVLDWMEAHLHREPEYGLTDRRGNAAGYLKHGRCPESEWDLLAVQICRALGIPATLSKQTGRFIVPEDTATVTLTLSCGESALREEEQFSLSRWNGNTYLPVSIQAGTVTGSFSVSLEPGAYCLITSRRQIDGTVCARVHRFLLSEDRQIPLLLESDETENYLIRKKLPEPDLLPLTENAELIARKAACQASLLIFLEPGKEPTEHLLQELIQDCDIFRGVPIRFCIGLPEELENATLSHALATLDTAAVYLCSAASRFPVQAAAGIGDGRLPLALVLDHGQNIVYGCANYNIRTAAALHRILSLPRVSG